MGLCVRSAGSGNLILGTMVLKSGHAALTESPAAQTAGPVTLTERKPYDPHNRTYNSNSRSYELSSRSCTQVPQSLSAGLGSYVPYPITKDAYFLTGEEGPGVI